MANNKIIYGGKTLIDLTGDTVTPSDLLVGKKHMTKPVTSLKEPAISMLIQVTQLQLLPKF